MQEKSLIKKNILYYIDKKGLTKYNFYQKTGITRGILDQNNGMSEENTAKFLAYFSEVNPEWLITGNGSMLKEEEISFKVQEPASLYNKIEKNERGKECDEKDIRIAELKETIAIQKDLIQELKKQIEFKDVKDAALE